jgi:hypothetical protein
LNIRRGWIGILFFAVEDAVQFEPQIVEVVVGRWIGKQFFDGGQVAITKRPAVSVPTTWVASCNSSS